MEPSDFGLLPSTSAPGNYPSNVPTTAPQFLLPPPGGQHPPFLQRSLVPNFHTPHVSLQSTLPDFLRPSVPPLDTKISSTTRYHDSGNHSNRRSPMLDNLSLAYNHSAHRFSQEDVNRIDEDFRQFLSAPSEETPTSRDSGRHGNVHGIRGNQVGGGNQIGDGIRSNMIGRDGVPSNQVGIDGVRSYPASIDAVRSNQIGDAVPRNQAGRHGVPSNQVRRDAVPNNQIGRDGVRSNQVGGDGVLSNQLERDVIRNNQVGSDGPRNNRIGDDVPSNRVEREDIPSNAAGNEVTRSNQVGSGGVLGNQGSGGNVHDNSRNEPERDNLQSMVDDEKVQETKTEIEGRSDTQENYDICSDLSPDEVKVPKEETASIASGDNQSHHSFHDDAQAGPSNGNRSRSISPSNDASSHHGNLDDDGDDDDDDIGTDDDEDDLENDDYDDDEGDIPPEGDDSDLGSLGDDDEGDGLSDGTDLNSDEENLSETENAETEAPAEIEEGQEPTEEHPKKKKKKKKKERDVFKDFVVQDGESEDDDDEDEEDDEFESEEEAGVDTESPDKQPLDEKALDHLTRLRARMSSREGGRDDVNRYFEALISYDDGIPSDKPASDEDWLAPEAESKKRNKIKKNRKGSPKKAHKCHICARIFYQAKQFEKHLATHNKKPKKPLSDLMSISKLPPGVKLPPQKSLTCETCGKVFRRSAHLTRHRLIHTGEKPHICDICGDRFGRPDKLRVHKKLHDKNRQFSCKVCGETFTLNKLLRLHKKTHKQESTKLYTCDVCNKNFTVYARLHRHRMIHTGRKPYLCEICGDRFTQSTDLQRHRIIHTGVKAHLCDLCGKKFYHSAHLRRHVKIHDRQKNYICGVCGGQFARSDILKRHEKIHTGEKEYACDQCGKLFTRSSHLQRHMVTHNGRPPMQMCKFCTKPFVSTEKLRQHIKMHHPLDMHQADMNASCSQQQPPQQQQQQQQPQQQQQQGQPQQQTHHQPQHHPQHHQQQQDHGNSVIHSRDCSATPDLSHPCTPVPVQSPCQRAPPMIQTPDQSRMQSPSARSQCSEPDRGVMQYRPFGGEQQFHFNHHLGLQPHQGFFSNGPRYDCMVCGEQFPNANMLEMHYSVHTLDKHPYIPNLPDKHAMDSQYIPPRPFDLHRHNDIYRCENCGDRFNDLGHFQIHCLMHTSDFSDSYQRQLQFPAPPFASPSFPIDKRAQQKMQENFRPLLGPIPQPQNLSMNQINPSCERSKQLPLNYRQDTLGNNNSANPTSAASATSPPDFPFQLTSQPPHQPQFPEPYGRGQHQEPPPLNNHANNAPSQNKQQMPQLGHSSGGPNDTTGPGGSYNRGGPSNPLGESNVPNKPVSIMNNLKPKKRPRLVEALPDSDQIHEAVGFTLDGRPVLNPDVNITRARQGEQRKYKCGTCGELFDTPQERIEHVKIHIADMEKQNSCEYCDNKFTNAQELRAHVKAEHRAITEKEEAMAGPAGTMDSLEKITYSPTPSVISSEVPVSMVPTTSSASGLCINFECSQCDAVFGTETGLRRHNRVHTSPKSVGPPKEYNCEVCFKSFLRPHHLTRHKLIHSGEKPYQCEHCPMAFARTDKLSSHLSKVHGLSYSPPKREIKCEKCDIVFGTKADLRDHLRCEHAESFDCETCFKSFKRMDHLRRHKRIHSKSPAKNHKNLLNICEYCNHEFKSEYDLNQHVRRVHNDQQTFQCGLCQAKFVNNDDLTLHQTLMHDADAAGVDSGDLDTSEVLPEDLEPAEEVKKPSPSRVRKPPAEVICEVCEQKFPNSAALTRHKRAEHKELLDEKSNCDLCGKEFLTNRQLRRHMKTHSSEKPYMCDECGDSFSRSSHLVRHKVRHTGQREFKCDQCPAQFSRSDHLLCHKRTHTGNKPYVCDICGLQFASGQGLKGHMTTHTGEKPYLCRHCGEQFARNSHLVRHRAQAHNDGITHKCELCGKTFNRRDQLKRHEKTHSGEKPHVCQTCGKAFTRAPLLLKHEKTHEKQHEPMTHSRIPISMMDWPKWADYHPPPMATGHPQFPFSGSILQAAMSASHIA